ncbi:MAG: flagellar biosynthetic protein FliO [Elioraea sp.]|nr:flagellar biosynthetic protein FliO [Elioraea sp.]MDW8443932.1 flagellar biosynthetic protein FliO [Acetobacteraceae bacterium]
MADPLSTLPWAIAALAITLAVILAAGRLAARIGLGSGPRSGRRLAVIEAVPLDSRRRLLVARCDETEFVLLVGGPNDVVWPLPARGA